MGPRPPVVLGVEEDGSDALGGEEVGEEAPVEDEVDFAVLAGVLEAGTADGAWGAAGGWTAALPARPLPAPCARAASEASSRGRRWAISAGLPAKEASGAGPIAAPTATPRASITVASTALARADGKRSTLAGADTGGDVGAGDAAVGDVGVWGVLTIACEAHSDATETEARPLCA